MQTTTKITFVGFLLAVSTLTVSAAKARAKMPVNSDASSNIEYRLSRITKAVQQRGIETPNTSNIEIEIENSIARGFANRSGGGGFANSSRGGFANRSGGGGFVNRSPWRNGGGFYNRY
ncbi:MAG: GrrA/OscA1 family cyclophane-containing rSAM-modified RiPP [Prochloraceae cyanobacterium]|nr:GrrA/OscA1 family cyclophane-containing rSAM-modified RiPP [Prochloraceae cyanobacterium]